MRDVATEDGRGQTVEGVVSLVNDVVVVLERLNDDDRTENFWKACKRSQNSSDASLVSPSPSLAILISGFTPVKIVGATK